MINKDRIVPIQKSDLLSMYGTFINLAFGLASQDPATVLDANNVDGDFTVDTDGVYLASQPVRSLDVTGGAEGTIFFVAAYDYVGMSIAGEAIVPTGAVDPDSTTLYQAVVDNGAVTITALTPGLSE